jgi:D-tyrosyl-tRNA(Tyr) deacylase
VSAPPQGPRYIVVVAKDDPVASRVAERWGTPPASGFHVEGAPLRQLSPGVLLLGRPGPHVHDDDLDRRLPPEVRSTAPTLVFPSIHRSEQNVACLTVHPLGNPGLDTGVGGRPSTLVPTDPSLMVAALRALEERARALGTPVTYEATHHGPTLGLPAFFVEIGYGEAPAPPTPAVDLLTDVVPRLEAEGGDRTAVGVGGGHYAPRFTELALRRRWAFGHLLSRHALPGLSLETARSARAQTPGADGAILVRAQDYALPAVQAIGPRLREADAPRRESPTPASGT